MPFAADLSHALEERLRGAPAQARPSSVEGLDEEAGGEEFARFLRRLASDRGHFLESAARLRDELDLLRAADDVFFDNEARASLRRTLALSREWAPRFGAFYFPETDPIAVSFAAWIRPYNDAVRTFVRTLLDVAHDVEARLAEEEEEDAEADAWVTSGGLERLRAAERA